eukprot:COSAG06_NODE_32853_length_499_cov_0.772500_1_plen_56_part_10
MGTFCATLWGMHAGHGGADCMEGPDQGSDGSQREDSGAPRSGQWQRGQRQHRHVAG